MNNCPLCGAARTDEERLIAECSTCGRDTWEDCEGVNQFERILNRAALLRAKTPRDIDAWAKQIAADIADLND